MSKVCGTVNLVDMRKALNQARDIANRCGITIPSADQEITKLKTSLSSTGNKIEIKGNTMQVCGTEQTLKNGMQKYINR